MSTTLPDVLSEISIPAAALTNQAEYIRTVRTGIPGSVVREAIGLFGGHRELFVRMLGTTSANLNRYYRKKTLSRVDTEEVMDALRVFNEASRVWGDKEMALEWLNTPIAALAGESPLALFDTFEGRNWVRQTLRKIEYGEFS